MCNSTGLKVVKDLFLFAGGVILAMLLVMGLYGWMIIFQVSSLEPPTNKHQAEKKLLIQDYMLLHNPSAIEEY